MKSEEQIKALLKQTELEMEKIEKEPYTLSKEPRLINLHSIKGLLVWILS